MHARLILSSLICIFSCYCFAETPLEVTLKPQSFSPQDAALCLHQLNLAVAQTQAQAEAAQQTAAYLQDFQDKLEQKQSRCGLLESEEQLLRQITSRLSQTVILQQRLRIRATEIEIARVKWGSVADIDALILLHSSFRLFPELQPRPVLYLPMINEQNEQFKLTVTTKKVTAQ